MGLYEKVNEEIDKKNIQDVTSQQVIVMRDYRLCVTEADCNKLLSIYGTMPEVMRCYISLSCILERNGIHDDMQLTKEFLETSERLRFKGRMDSHIWSSLTLHPVANRQ